MGGCDDARTNRPFRRGRSNLCGNVRKRRQNEVERAGALQELGNGRAKNGSEPADLAAAAAWEYQYHRRVCFAPACLFRAWAQIADLFSEWMAHIGAVRA